MNTYKCIFGDYLIYRVLHTTELRKDLTRRAERHTVTTVGIEYKTSLNHCSKFICRIGVDILIVESNKIFNFGWVIPLRGRPQLTHPPQFGTSGTATHWFSIDTPLIWNIRVCDTVLTIGLLCVEILIRVSMGVSKLAKPVCC